MGDCEAGPYLSPSQALLGCTQSQPNKKPFIGRVQLSQTGWEHVAFKNEEGGIRGMGRGGGPESKNEEYDSGRKTDNKNTEAETLIDRERHKTNCVFPERTLLKYCLASSVKAGFTLGMQKQMGCL